MAKPDYTTFGKKISEAINNQSIPGIHYNLVFDLITDEYHKVTITWSYYSDSVFDRTDIIKEQIDLDKLCGEISSVLDEYYGKNENVICVIRIPHFTFDEYISRFPEELNQRGIINKNHSNKNKNYSICFQRAEIIKMSAEDVNALLEREMNRKQGQ